MNSTHLLILLLSNTININIQLKKYDTPSSTRNLQIYIKVATVPFLCRLTANPLKCRYVNLSSCLQVDYTVET